MSSIRIPVIRKFCVAALAPIVLAPLSAQAQEQAPAPDGETRIDILVTPEDLYPDERAAEDCKKLQDAAILSREIVVCGQGQDQRVFRTQSAEEAKDRYARETMYKDKPPTPDPCGPNCGIFKGDPTIGGLCIPGLQKCPPPPAIFIDVSALPEAPPGSDADRIARGLPPIGNDLGTEEEKRRRQQASETAEAAGDVSAVSLSAAEAPEEEP